MNRKNNLTISNNFKDDESWMISDQELAIIHNSDPEMYRAIKSLISQIAGTFSDKYNDKHAFIQTKILLYGKNGKFANIHSATKYIQRYSTNGFDKSENPTDLLKAIHYLLFEKVRKSIESYNLETNEPEQNNNKSKKR